MYYLDILQINYEFLNPLIIETPKSDVTQRKKENVEPLLGPTDLERLFTLTRGSNVRGVYSLRIKIY